MLAHVRSVALVGLSAVEVTVEVDIASQGLPAFTIVGLPDKAIEESKERVRSAIKNSGAEFPAKRITVNLAPADLPKNGPSYDLPIALGILLASEQLTADTSGALFFGELSLDGGVRHTNGILPLALFAKKEGVKEIFIPASDFREASIVRGISVYPNPTLIGLVHHLSGLEPIDKSPYIPFSELLSESDTSYDMADIVGQEQVKRALEIAAAGGHNVFMQGPPGAGKTLLARTLPTILPELTEQEALEVTNIYSITGNLPSDQSIITQRPFRAPHHTTSRIGLIGGGTHPTPGEISLAHRGILFCDEFPEFPRHVLEALRQPIEDGIVTISRAAGSVTYPAKFLLVAAANPCPCGNFGSQTKHCTCMPGAVTRYKKRISGPILDRIDLHIHVPAVPTEELTKHKATSENSKEIRSRVQKARNIQLRRLSESGIPSNGEMTTKMVKAFCPLSEETLQFLKKAMQQFSLSARSYYRVIKMARTIADLEGDKMIAIPHLAEALQYRHKEE